MLRKLSWKILSLLFTLSLVTTHVVAQNQAGKAAIDPAGIQRLQTDTGGAAKVTINRATGAARFVRLPAEKTGDLTPSSARAAAAQQKAAAFFRQYGSIFGISQPDGQLKEVGRQQDRTGATHISYQQYYAGIPVFGAVLKAHFNAKNQLRTVNGTAVPNILVNPVPVRSAASAAETAIAKVNEVLKPTMAVSARRTQLMVFQAGLAQGVDLGTHLVWEIEVGNGKNVREFVFVDAHNGKVVDQITGTPDSLYRRAYDGQNLPGVPPSYPDDPFWKEGDAFPTPSQEANNMIIVSQETYDFYSHAFERDSFDGHGAIMDSIFDRGYSCPNASWNGTFISFCPGFTTDDVTAHEWSHAYTEYTDGLIYQWQSGALNESYSDIYGETVDQLNSVIGTDNPGGPRSSDQCSSFSPPKSVLQVNTPPAIAGLYPVQPAQFGPTLTTTGVTGNVVYASPANGCSALTNGAQISGNIALIDRGTCTFVVKVKNAQLAGATAVIVANNVSSGLPGMGGTDATIVIPSVGITQADGNKIKANLPVNATLKASDAPTDNSLRWLQGEDVGFNNPPNGALRDMWNPACYSNPGKVTDFAYYTCDAADGGGVHTNSGVPNHAYALIVDGGSYNGKSVTGIGLTKAAHIYWQAKTVYQVPYTDFADHADALEAACTDLRGINLRSLTTGDPSGEIITTDDCTQVSNAIAAVELRTPPTQCNFQPLLAKNPPAKCAVNKSPFNIFFDNFESSPLGSWTVSHDAVHQGDFIPRDWDWKTSIPDRTGSAFFATDADIGTCLPGGDQSGVLHLTSPVINIPRDSPKPFLAFQHWVATEAGFDGGNLRIKVNGGPWQLVDRSAFFYNPYNTTLNSTASGNTDPLAGQAAFSGSDGGMVSGSWGWSYIDIHKYLPPSGGRPYTLQVRWDLGTDGCGGLVGWYLDDVTLYACRPN